MRRYGAACVLGSLFACGPTVMTAGNDGGTAASSSSSSGEPASDESEASGDESGDPQTCRQLAPQLVARWSTVVDPDLLTFGVWLRATSDGGAALASTRSLVMLDGAGAPAAVQWFGSLAASAFELGDGDEVWVAGLDDQLTVARFDVTGELARGGRAALDEEYAVDIAREPDGGALVLSRSDGLRRLEHVDAGVAFGAAVAIDVAGFPPVEIHPGGLMLVTRDEIGGASITAIDRAGAELWRTELALDEAEVPFLGSASTIGELLYVAVSQTDLATSPQLTSHWLFGLGLADGTQRFALETTSGVIAATPCGGVYLLELREEAAAPRMVLTEYDALGVVRSESELAAPLVPAGFAMEPPRSLDVAADGTVLVHGHLVPVEDGDRLDWAAAY